MTEAQGGKGSIKLRQCPPGDPVVGFFGAVLRSTRSISSRNSLHWETPAHRTRALSGVRQSFLELSCLESPRVPWRPFALLCPISPTPPLSAVDLAASAPLLAQTVEPRAHLSV